MNETKQHAVCVPVRLFRIRGDMNDEGVMASSVATDGGQRRTDDDGVQWSKRLFLSPTFSLPPSVPYLRTSPQNQSPWRWRNIIVYRCIVHLGWVRRRHADRCWQFVFGTFASTVCSCCSWAAHMYCWITFIICIVKVVERLIKPFVYN